MDWSRSQWCNNMKLDEHVEIPKAQVDVEGVSEPLI